MHEPLKAAPGAFRRGCLSTDICDPEKFSPLKREDFSECFPLKREDFSECFPLKREDTQVVKNK